VLVVVLVVMVVVSVVVTVLLLVVVVMVVDRGHASIDQPPAYHTNNTGQPRTS
jgi:heme/copper-type cytochrome/quinol oxidase subunit 2